MADDPKPSEPDQGPGGEPGPAAEGDGAPGAEPAGKPPRTPTEERRRRILIVVGGLLAALVVVAVVLIVARPEKRTVPSVTGQDLAAAQEILEDDGFEVEVRRVTNVAADGRVLGQDPQAGSEADKGSDITLTVSDGPGEGTVPDVADLPEPRAQAALREAGFQPVVRQEFSSAVRAGQAIRTRPQAGTRLRRASRIVLVVSRGPQQVEVPNVVGEPEATARQQVQQAGLQLEVVQQRANRDPGDVLHQAPAPNTIVTLGSTVRIVVDKAPQPVRVPNVTGQPETTASSELSSAGLAVFYVVKEVTNPAQAGEVLSQRPAAGASVPPGSRVVLQIARVRNPPPVPPTPPVPPPTTPTTPTQPTQPQTTTTSP